MHHMSGATLLIRRRSRMGAGVVEMVVWRVPKPVPPSDHGFKYRLVYVVGGVRVVGYDNERGKGDHRHADGEESAYDFTTLEALLADFERDVTEWRMP